ncbi:hypothetical protein NG726_26495 [Pseudomonas sp. MOB-449]|nr:hypothetical protein [Pseudomonas sp. MOB-449]
MMILPKLVVVTVASWSFLSAHANAEDMTWAVLAVPGAAIHGVGMPDEGIVLDAQSLLEAQLPGLNHRHERTTPRRLDRDLSAGRSICSTLTLRNPDRSKSGVFIPYLPALPMELVSRTDRLPDFVVEHGMVSLTKLLETPLKGGISSTRAYPPELAKLIDKGVKHGTLEIINTSSPGVNLIAMVSLKRLDYTFEFPIVSAEIRKAIPYTTVLVSVPIMENPSLIPTGIYCPRNVWGKQMAQRIDIAIQRLVSKPEPLLQLYRSQEPSYEPQLREYFRERGSARIEW